LACPYLLGGTPIQAAAKEGGLVAEKRLRGTANKGTPMYGKTSKNIAKRLRFKRY